MFGPLNMGEICSQSTASDLHEDLTDSQPVIGPLTVALASIDTDNQTLITAAKLCSERDWIRANPQEYDCSAWKNACKALLDR